MFRGSLHIILTIYIFLKITGSKKMPLYIGYLQELTELPNWYDKVKFFPRVVDYTLNIIQNRTDILPSYEIKTILKDVKFSGGYGSQAIIELMEEEPRKIAVLGPVHSTILTFTGQIAPIYKVVEIFYGESTPKIDTQSDLYSTLFNVNQRTRELNLLRIEMMKYFGWSRVGTIAREGDNWKYQIDHFHELLVENNMSLISSAVLADQSSSSDVIRTFKQFNVKIIMAAVFGDDARDLFCEAYHKGLYGNGYVWVISGPTLFNSKIVGDAVESEMSCTMEELIRASSGHFLVSYKYVSNSREPTVSGKVPEEIMADIIEMNAETGHPLDKHASILYDAVWALALGLNNSVGYLEEEGLQLHQYNYTDVFLDCVMKGLHDVNFDGVSGPVSFDGTRNRIGLTYIQQNFNDTIVDIATYNPRHGNITWLIPIESIWSGQNVPKDRFTYETVPVPSNTVAFVVVIIIDLFGCTLSLTFLTYNVYHRNKSLWMMIFEYILDCGRIVNLLLESGNNMRFIKMSSPNINNVIIAGSFILYMEVLLNAVDYMLNMNVELGGHICMVHTWMKVIGFTVLFGALFSKTYRVYVIFRNARFKSKIVKDVHLFLMIGIMLIMDLLILLPWSVSDPLVKERQLEQVQGQQDKNVIFAQTHFHCVDSYQVYWVAATYVYKGLLLAFGLFLAWETRQVNVPALNDSKYIGACIYNVFIVCIFGVPLAHVLPVEESTLSFVLQSCLILFCTIICLCIIFVPKIQMQKQVHGRFVTEQMSSRMTTATTCKKNVGENEIASGSQSNRTMNDIVEENKSLRMQIAAETIAIAKLKKSLIGMTGNMHFYKSGTEYVLFRTDGPTISSIGHDENTKLN